VLSRAVKHWALWEPDELETLRRAVANGWSLAAACALFPERSYHSVKDRYYSFRPQREAEYQWYRPAFEDAKLQKAAREGSAQLLEAIERYHPHQVSHRDAR